MSTRERRARTYVHVKTETGDFFTGPKNGRALCSALVSKGEVLLVTEELAFTTAKEAVMRETYRRPFAAFEGLSLYDFRPTRKSLPLRGTAVVNPRATAASFWQSILKETETAEEVTE